MYIGNHRGIPCGKLSKDCILNLKLEGQDGREDMGIAAKKV